MATLIPIMTNSGYFDTYDAFTSYDSDNLSLMELNLDAYFFFLNHKSVGTH